MLLQTGSLNPAAASALLTGAATPNVLSGIGASANLLLFSDVRPATVATVTMPLQQQYCTFGVAAQLRDRLVSVTAAASDSAGNVYTAYTSAEPPLCYSGSTWLVTPAYTAVEKRTASGTLLWASTVTSGLNLTDVMLRMLLTPSGDIVVAGSSFDCSVRRQTATCQGNSGGFVARLNGISGVTLWLRRIDSTGADSVSGLHLAGSNLTIAGTTSGQVGQSSFGSNDAFVAQIDVNTGRVATSPAPIQFGTPGSDTVSDLTFFNTQLLVVGSTDGTLGAVAFGGTDAFFAPITLFQGTTFFLGQTIQVGTAGTDTATAAVGVTEVLPDGNAERLYVVGRTNGTFVGQTNQGGYDVFHLRIDDTLSRQAWLFQHGTAADEPSPTLALGSDDFFIAAGTYLLKGSRVSGLTAWKTVEPASRTLMVAEPTRHILWVRILWIDDISHEIRGFALTLSPLDAVPRKTFAPSVMVG